MSTQQLSRGQQILLQKQQEHAGLQALREASAGLLERVEKLAEMSNVMADGGEAIGSVLRNWPHVFSILNMFDPPANTTTNPTQQSQEQQEEEEPPERLPALVRLPYHSEQPTAK